MSALATISFVVTAITLAIWLVAFGLKLVGRRSVPVPTAAGSAHRTHTDRMLRELALDPYAFLFDRSLPAAAGSTGTKRAARQSIVSADGAVSINLISPSRREIEISIVAANQSPGTIVVVHVTDEFSDRRVFIPLAANSFESTVSGQLIGVALIPTTAQEVGISRDLKFIQVSDLGMYSEGDISRSVRAAAGPTRRWWQELLEAAEAGQVVLPERALSAIAEGITKH